MKIKSLFILLTIITLLVFSCSKNDSKNNNENKSKKEQIVVSIPPLKWLTQKIAGDDFEVISIVSKDMNHELFEPRPKDLSILEKSKILFIYDTLAFEHVLEDSITDKSKVISVTKGIPNTLFLEGHDDHEESNSQKHEHGHDGIDPHVWFSLEMMPLIADNIKLTLISKYPDKKQQFEENYKKFINEFNIFSNNINNNLNDSDKKSFIIYHPALNYFLHNRKNIVQIEIEQEGKEPSAKYIQEVITTASKNNVKLILLQPQFPKQSAQAIANEIPNSKVMNFNVLEEDIFKNLNEFVTDLKQ